MGGVDLIDSLIGLYRLKLKSKKWYHRLFFHLLDMTIVNAWILYRREFHAESTSAKTIPLREFKCAVAEALCKSGVAAKSAKRGRPKYKEEQPVKKKRPAACAPVEDVRFDGLHHYPAMKEVERQRCRKCDKVTQVSCVKCGIHLCMSSKRNCFLAYHIV